VIQQLKRLSWRLVAQTGELRFHQRNRWRQSADFMEHTAALFRWWGYQPTGFEGRRIVDIGAGSRLRSRYFTGARVVAIEPLAERFTRTIPWADLKEADAVYATPAEKRIPELVASASFAMCLNVLDHTYDPWAVLTNAYAYLQPGSEFVLSVDLHDHGEAGLSHPVHLTRADLQAGLARAGFDIIREYDGLGPTGTDSYGHGRAYTAIARRPARDKA
jgi:SAM-dependent methyltransferase